MLYCKEGTRETQRLTKHTVPVMVQQYPPNVQHPNGYIQWDYQPLAFQIVKELKQAVMAYGMQSSYVMGLLQGLADEHRFIPHDWEMLCCTVLEAG